LAITTVNTEANTIQKRLVVAKYDYGRNSDIFQANLLAAKHLEPVTPADHSQSLRKQPLLALSLQSTFPLEKRHGL
jgi:hypothetical protein